MKFKAMLIPGVVCSQFVATRSLFSKESLAGKEQGPVSLIDLSDDAIHAIAENFAKKY